MVHLTEDDLVLYRFEESPDRAVVERHLAECQHCRTEYAALERVLGLLEADVPEPAPAYERQVWMQIEGRLAEDRAAGWARRWLGDVRERAYVCGGDGCRSFWQVRPGFGYWLVPQAALAAIIGLLLAGSFAIDRLIHPSPETAPVTVAEQGGSDEAVASEVGDGKAPARRTTSNGRMATALSDARGRVLFAAVGEHLQRSELMLSELNNFEADADVDLSEQQASAEDLISENRLYRQTAAGVGAVQLVSLLDDLERALLDVAHAPSSATPEEIDQLRLRLEAEDVLFKVRVAGAGLRARRDVAARNAPLGETGSGL